MSKKFPKKFLSWLKNEINEWQEEKLITSAQAEELQGRYNSYNQLSQSSGKLILVLSLLGVILIGGGFIMLIASNWEAIPRLIRVLFIFGLVIGVNLTGFYLKYQRKNYPKVGEALLLLTSILFGVAIWLIAQTFHITSKYYMGMFLWFIGVFPLVLLLRLNSLLFFSSFLLSFWNIWKVSHVDGLNLLYPFMMLLVIFPIVYFKRHTLSFFISLSGIIVWFCMSILASYFHDHETMIFFVLFLLAILLFILGILHNNVFSFPKFGTFLTWTSLLFLYSMHYIFSFRFVKEILEDYTEHGVNDSFLWLGSLFTLLILASTLLIFLKQQKRGKNFHNSGLRDSALAIIQLLIILLYLVFPHYILTALLSNLSLLAIIVLFVWSGFENKCPAYINLGFLLFILFFFTRYVDWGWEYLSRSFFFLSAGIILLAGSIFLEKKRRKLLQKMEQKS